MTKSPTINDIARAANVSVSTVSRVLTGVVPVAPDKRAAVLAAIDELKFRPNIVARSLVRGKTMAIGVLTQSMASPFYGDLAFGIEQALQGSAYHPMFASGNWDIESERAALSALIGRQVDAVIVLGGSLPDEDLHAAQAQVPLIVVGRTILGLEQYCLRVEDYEGAYRATRHLIELGHRRIAHISGISVHADAQERRRGYMHALHDAGIEPDQRLLIEGQFTEQSGLKAVEALLDRDAMFTALFAANDQMAYGARLAFYRHGLDVPNDISLIGFDDQPNSAFSLPPLTTVRQHTYEMGQAAAQGVVRLLAGEQPNLPVFSADLVLRESTARPR